MNNKFGIIATLIMTLSLAIVSIPDVEARRFGAGRSFGGKSSFNSPYRRSATSQPNRSASQQKAYKQNQTARQTMSRRGGLMGMFGALALGGLLGSLFFGGAFENFNFMDILVFGGIAYLLYRMFSAKSGRTRAPAYGRSPYRDYQENRSQSHDNFSQQSHSSAAFDTDILFNKDTNQAQDAIPKDSDFESSQLPPGFIEKNFLEGAEIAFRHLQDAWDRRDLAEIRGLTTDKVFAEIQEQLQASDEVNKTDLLKIESELLEVRALDSELEAVVLFDCIMRENLDQQAEQVREVWHFIKSKKSIQPKWYLDGIQQLQN